MLRFFAKVLHALPTVLPTATCALLGLASGVRAQEPPEKVLPPPIGPLHAEEGAPLQRLGYTPMVEEAATLEPGALRTELWLGYANIFEEDSASTHRLYLDMERLVTAVALRYGVADGLELGAHATFETRWGGVMDSFLVEFHEALALGNRNRTRYPTGQNEAFLQDGSGRVLVEVPGGAFELRDVRLAAKWRVAAGSRGTVSLRAVGRIPTGETAASSARTDLGVMMLSTLTWRGVHVHAMAGGTTVRRTAETQDLLRGHQWFGMLGVERPFRDGLSGVVQFTGSTQLLRGFDDHDVDGAPTNVVFGVVGETEGGWRWEVGMQEDFPPRGPSIDFTLQLALARTW